MSAVTVAGLTVRRGRRTVLDHVDLVVEPGEVVAVVGPNGAGKSTLLRTLMGELSPSEGAVALFDIDGGRWSPRERARRVAFVAQAPLFPTGLSVRAYVELGRTPYRDWLGRDRGDGRGAVDRAIASASLAALAERALDTLSGGERQRAALARALAQEPGLFLLDEPTANLDLRHQRDILELVRAQAHECRVACVVTLHDLNLASQFSDRVVVMVNGRIAHAGPPSEVLTAAMLAASYETPLVTTPHPQVSVPLVTHAGSAAPQADASPSSA